MQRGSDTNIPSSNGKPAARPANTQTQHYGRILEIQTNYFVFNIWTSFIKLKIAHWADEFSAEALGGNAFNNSKCRSSKKKKIAHWADEFSTDAFGKMLSKTCKCRSSTNIYV